MLTAWRCWDTRKSLTFFYSVLCCSEDNCDPCCQPVDDVIRKTPNLCLQCTCYAVMRKNVIQVDSLWMLRYGKITNFFYSVLCCYEDNCDPCCQPVHDVIRKIPNLFLQCTYYAVMRKTVIHVDSLWMLRYGKIINLFYSVLCCYEDNCDPCWQPVDAEILENH